MPQSSIESRYYKSVIVSVFLLFTFNLSAQFADCIPDSTLNVYLDASGSATIAVTDIDAGGSFGNLSIDRTTFTCADIGSVRVTLTAENVGSTVNCSTFINVIDNIPPTIVTAGAITGYTSEDGVGDCTKQVLIPNATANDNCSHGIISWTMFGATSGSGIGQVGNYSYNVGLTIIRYSVTDGSGLTVTADATVEIFDDENPTISCVGNQTRNTDAGTCYYTVVGTEFDPTITNDNCGGGSTVINDFNSLSTLAGAQIPDGTVIVWSINDGINSETCSFTVTVADNELPTIITAGAVTGNTSDGGTGDCTKQLLIPNAVPSDNCSLGAGGITWIMSGATSGSGTGQVGSFTYNVGLTTIAYSVTDAAGGTTTETATVEIFDDENPIISCVGNQVKSADSGQCYYTVVGTEFDPVSVSDNCIGFTISNDFNGSNTLDGAQIPDGTTVIWTVTDGNLNTGTCSFIVTVTDDEDPLITCPPNVSVNANSSCEANTVSLGTPTTSDNCGVASVTNNAPSTFPLGTVQVTWTVTDTAGRTSTCIQSVTVVDVTPPTITSCPIDITVSADAGLCTASGVSLGTPTYSDNCSVGISNNAPAIFPVGTTTVTWTATDGEGLTSTCTQTVTVEDNEDPIANCQNFTGQLDPITGTLTVLGNQLDNGSTDNCSTNFSLSQSSFTCADIGDNPVTFTVTDNEGNSDTCSAIITITDAAENSSVSITTSNTTVCQGSPTTFTATPTNGGITPMYQWQINGSDAGAPTTSATFVTSSLNHNDIVTVSMTSDLSVCATPKLSNSLQMTLNSLLPVSFSIVGDTTICDDELITFLPGTITNGGGSPTYRWLVNGTPQVTTPNFSTSSLNDGDVVTLEVSSDADCANPVPASESVTITVNPLPTVVGLANGSSSNITICAGDPVVLTGSGAANYSWDNGGVDGVAIYPTTTTIFTVTGTDGSSCENTDTITVTVTPDTTITLTSAAVTESQNICSGSAMTAITYQLTNATGANIIGTLPSGVSSSFDPGTGIFTISGNPTTTETTTGDLYSFSIEPIGCNPTTVDAFIGVYGATPSVPTSHDGPYNICVGAVSNNATVNFSIPIDQNAVTYNWGMPNGNFNIIAGTNTNEVTVNITQGYDWSRFLQPQTYDIDISVTNPCGTSSEYTFEVELQYLDVLDITAGEDVYVCEDTMTVEMAGGTDGPLGSGLDYDEWDWYDSTGTDDNFDHDATYQECVRVCTRYWPWGWCRTYTETCTDYTHPELISNYNLPTSNPGDVHTITLEGGNGTCDTVTDDMNIYVIEKPNASLGSDINICENGTAEITITGTEYTDVSYSYNSGGQTGTISLDASGSATFTTTVLLASTVFNLTSASYNSNRFPSGVRNLTCTETLTETLNITVNTLPTVQDVDDQSICSNGTATLAATLGGTNPNGLWTTTGDGTFNDDTLEAAVYTPGPIDIFNGSVVLTFTNTPSGPCGPVSDTMTLTINEDVNITTQPQNLSACVGNIATFSVGATGDGLTYQWYGGSGAISGANSSTYSINPVNVSDSGNYYVIVTGTGGCNPETSNTVSLSVNEIAITSQPVSFTNCEGNNVSFSVGTTGTVSTYQWYHNGVVISGANAATLNLANIDAADAGNYHVVMTGPYCASVSSGVAILGVTDLPTVNLSYSTSVLCSNGGSSSPSLTGTNAFTGGSYSAGSGLSINSTTGVIDAGSSTPGTYTVVYTTLSSGGCASVQTQTSVTINELNATANAGSNIDNSASSCGDTTVTLAANSITASGASGAWSVTSGQLAGTYFFSDSSSPTSSFTGQSGETYTLQWSITNASSCAGSFDTTQVQFADCGSFIDFDGTDDYISFGDSYDQGGSFSIEAWVKSEANSGTKTILSKRDASTLNKGYDLRIQGNNFSFRYNGSGLLTSSRAMATDRWYHIAVTFDGSNYNMYQDGILVNSSTGITPTSNSAEFLIGAMDRSSNIPVNYFNGWLDEIRLWNVALTQTQIREMMNQEIQNNGGNIEGGTIPRDISGLTWSNLEGYYQMNQSVDLASGYLASNSASGLSGNLINITTSQSESAPLPYSSNSDGNWTNSNTWLNGNVQLTPNNSINGTEVVWNIVETNHNVSSGDKDITVLGLFVNDNKLSIENSDAVNGGQSVRVISYLSIDGNGVLDLVGESQLLQDEGSWVNEAGAGYLERDQQGIANSFAYNYWSSPVSLDSGAGNNLDFTLNDVLFDGRDSDNPQPINYGGRYDYYFADGGSSGGEQLKLATSWIYKYAYSDRTAAYANWDFVGNTGTLEVTDGFSMKGASGATSLDLGVASQNLVFRGKPNNVPNGQTELLAVDFAASGSGDPFLSLIGNPFPSAIDANEFLADNSTSTDGTLLFWEHWSDNTHLVRSYQGGYAVYNSSGGNQATSLAPHPNNPTITPGSSPRRVPQRYIPIGQGFMVKSSAAGGRVVFKNSQRVFYKETGSSSNYIKPGGGKDTNDIETDDGTMRIRLGIDTPQGIHRPLLIAFIEGATDAHDHLFDAEALEQNRSDAFMLLEDQNFIIQGFGEFDYNRQIPIVLNIAEEDETYPVKFMIDGLENFPDDIEIYVKDFDNNGETSNIRSSSSFDIKLGAGEYKERFAIVFKSREESIESVEEIEDAVKIYANGEYEEIRVIKTRDIDFNHISLFNSIGQKVLEWDTNLDKLRLSLPVNNLSTGIYIITIDSPKGSISKKLLLD